MFVAEQIVLSISLLASNRPDSIRKCLDSLKPIMEQIPSELILTDTSGDEKLHQILLGYTDRVVNFAWCNDFSAARNVGLKLARGEWFLYLDDDEWFVEIEPLIHFFKSGEYKNYTCANYIQRNFYDAEYANYSDSWVSRMVKLTPETCFKSKIHEYPYPSGDRCKYLSAVVYHSGYIFSTPEARRKHFDRNVSLLLEMIEQEPDKLRWKVQLAQEYRSINDWQQLHDYCLQALEESKHVDDQYGNYDIGTFYVGAMESLIFLKRYDESIQVGERALDDKRNSLLCQTFLYLSFATAYFRKKDYAQADHYVHKYFRCAKQLRKDPEKLTMQQSALLVDEALDSLSTRRAYSILIACGLRRKDVQPLRKHLKDLEWDQKVIYVFDGMVDEIVDAAATLPFDESLVQASQYLWNNAQAGPMYFVQAQQWADDKESFFRILSVIARFESEHSYVFYARFRVADEKGDAAQVKDALADYYAHCNNVLLVPDDVAKIVAKYEISVEPYYLSLNFETWKKQIDRALTTMAVKGLLNIEKEFRRNQTVESPYYDALYFKLAETKAFLMMEQHSWDVKHTWLKEFADAATHICETYYQPHIPEDYPELLSEDLRAGRMIAEGLQQEQTDLREALKCYKKAMEECPNFSELLQHYVHELQREQENRAQREKDELRQLQQRLRAEAEKALTGGDAAMAYEVACELQKARPDDLAVINLKLKARLAMLEVS